jgi:hypothetical protein
MRCCDICQQSWSLAYCGQHRQQRQPRPMLPASARVPCAAPASLDHIYQGLLAALPLSPCPSPGPAAAWLGGQRDPPSTLWHIASERACGARHEDGRTGGGPTSALTFLAFMWQSATVGAGGAAPGPQAC